MKKLIKVLTLEAGNCFIGGHYHNLITTALIYKEERDGLFGKKTSYNVKYCIPYIKNPFYDGDYTTNNILSSYKKMLEAKAEIYIANQEANHDTTDVHGKD